jgi:phosphopantetheinyl transferase
MVSVNHHRMVIHAETTQKPCTVYYGSARLCGDRQKVKNELVWDLLRRGGFKLSAVTNMMWFHNDNYGCPQLFQQSVALSFSSFKQEIWAAVAQTEALGIDVESPENFHAPYPYGRAFQAGEFQLVSHFCVNREDAAALLWSCKEAAMKKRGTGFHFTDPRDVRICSCMPTGHWMYAVVVKTPEKVTVAVKREHQLWLALAVSE